MMSDELVLKNLDAYEIQKYQQNRYPCFFVDFIEEAVPGKSACGYKNFTFNEWFFPAHFEDEPNVPGFIQVETLTQVFLMTFLTIPENKGKKTGFISINNARFRKKLFQVIVYISRQNLNRITGGWRKEWLWDMLIMKLHAKLNWLLPFQRL